MDIFIFRGYLLQFADYCIFELHSSNTIHPLIICSFGIFFRCVVFTLSHSPLLSLESIGNWLIVVISSPYTHASKSSPPEKLICWNRLILTHTQSKCSASINYLDKTCKEMRIKNIQKLKNKKSPKSSVQCYSSYDSFYFFIVYFFCFLCNIFIFH